MHVSLMGEQNDLKMKCKKLMKVESLLEETYGIFVNGFILLIHVLNIDSHIL